MASPRTYKFSLTVTVEPGQDGHDDPEWIADAAWGALTNLYGYRCTYGGVIDMTPDSETSASQR